MQNAGVRNEVKVLQSGGYKFPETDGLFLHNLLVTAALMVDEPEIRIHTVGCKKYRDAIQRYKLCGISVKAERVSSWDYGCIVTVQPVLLLGSLKRFQKDRKRGSTNCKERQAIRQPL